MKLTNTEPKILAIDTSCDETSAAVLQGRKILSNIVSSQVNLHKKWGGVVPNIARRAHKENLPNVVKEALKRSRINMDDLDYIAVTHGPGLAIALETGIDYAKKLSMQLSIPLIKVNHIEAHLLSSFSLNSKGNGNINNELLKNDKDKIFPALGLVLSGSHTDLVYINDIGDYKVLGETLDDAIGEAFDKVARMLNLGYPGGPIITRLAKESSLRKTDSTFNLPVPMKKSGDYNFSYSGLKTACLYRIKEIDKPQKDWVNDFTREFINVCVKSIEVKLKRAFKEFSEVHSLFIGGGVTSNEYIVRNLSNLAREYDVNFYLPDKKYRTDNAGMIGVAAYFQIQQNRDVLKNSKEIEALDRDPNLRL